MFLKVNRDEIIEGLRVATYPAKQSCIFAHLASMREWKRQRDEHGFQYGIHGLLSGFH